MLCDLGPLHLPIGLVLRNGQIALSFPSVNYDGVVDTMFNMIRQNASQSPAVLIRLIEVLTAAASCERDPERLQTLLRHADLVRAGAELGFSSKSDLKDLLDRHAKFVAMIGTGLPDLIRGEQGAPQTTRFLASGT